MSLPLAVACCCFVAGLAAGFVAPPLFALVLALCIVLVGAREHRRDARWALGCIFCAGLLAASHAAAGPRGRLACVGAGPLRATIVQSGWAPLGIGQAVVASIDAQRCAAGWFSAAGRVRLHLKDQPAVTVGDGIEVRVAWLPWEPRRNPTDPDPFWSALRQGLFMQAKVLSPHAIVHHAPSWRRWLRAAHDAVLAIYARRMSPEAAAMAAALALGARGDMDPELRDAWARAGLTHLLAVSGMHVGIITAAIFWLVRALLAGAGLQRYSARRLSAALAIAPCIVFCLWVGAPVSAVRATYMAALYLIAVASARQAYAINTLMASAWLMLALDPTQILDVGFLLSVASVLGLLLAARAEQPAVAGRRRALWRWLRAGFVTSCAATVATLPISVYVFGYVAPIAPLANLLAVPLGALLATPLALLLAIVGNLSEAALRLGAVAFEWMVALLNAIAWRAAPLSVRVPQLTGVELCALTATIMGAWSLWRTGRGRVPMLAGAVLLLVCAGARILPTAAVPELRVVMPYVGHGDATLILLPDGGAVLVDAGGTAHASARDPGRYVVAPTLIELGVRSLDLAVLTHPHPDHIGGFDYVTREMSVAELWYGGRLDDSELLRRIAGRVEARGGRVLGAQELPARTYRGGVVLDLVYPRERVPATWNVNNHSLVLRLQYGERSLLLTGDIEEEAEAELAPSLARAEVLKVAHHGSATSSSPQFIDAVRPRLALISVGVRSRFGLPHARVLQRYGERGVPLLRTDMHGMITLRTDGVGPWRVTTHLAVDDAPGGAARPLQSTPLWL